MRYVNSLNILGSNAGPIHPRSGKSLDQLDGSTGWTGAGCASASLSSQIPGASFASLFAVAAKTPVNAGDPAAALVALIGRGTPLSTIVDRLAQQLAGAVQQKLPAGANADGRTALAKSIANALAPPGTAPPGTATDQVAALAARLQTWIATLAGEAKNQAGQQNDIAGTILDAKSAKDIPAQRTSETASSDLDPAALARALLESVASTLSPAPVLPATGSNVGMQSATPASIPASASQITMANAPDLLARMLVRAAGVDALINGTASQGSRQVLASGGTDNAPGALAARLASVLDSGGLGAESQQSDAKSQDPNGSPFNAPAAGNIPGNALFVVSPDATSVRPLVDPNAVIEQVVKSMMLRTTQTGTSEIHLHLSPENLGDITMKLTVSGSSISANIVAQNGEVRNALLQNQQQLVRSLSDAGMTLSGFSVDVSGGDAKRDQQKDRTAGFGRRYVVHELGGATNDIESAQPSSLGPALLPNSSLELLNYLA